MKVIAINGSPRKEWNTGTMLRHALDGAKSAGAETKLIHLFDLDTYQFEDYSKMVAPRFDPAKKLKRRQEVFPQDCRMAFEMGRRFAGSSRIQS